jgi:hypothetical protein
MLNARPPQDADVIIKHQTKLEVQLTSIAADNNSAQHSQQIKVCAGDCTAEEKRKGE